MKSRLKMSRETWILLFCGGLLLFVLALPAENRQEQETNMVQEEARAQTDAAATREEALEMRVRRLLSGVEGVGDVEVMIMLKSETDVMFREATAPEVTGVIISADGGENSVVKSEITGAMEALFGLPAHKIKVLKRIKKETE